MKTREEALALDRDDPLASLRDQFALPDGVIYLDGNSLGAQPRAAAARAQQVIGAEWGEGLIRSWNTAGWFALPRRLGDRLAPLVGAAAGEIAITDTISINLFKLLSAMLRHQAQRAPKRRVIVSERSNFPTDLYIAQGLIAQLGGDYELRLVDDPADLPDALDDETAVAMITHVNYRTGYMHDMPSVTQTVRQAGALMLWDLAHSAGAVPVDLNGALADGAVGCTYKYLNGGPGSPAFVWVPKRHQHAFEQPLSGWWGHRAPFAMQPTFEPDPGIARFLCGTQPIVSMSMVECGLDVFAQTDMHAIRRKSLALTDAFIALVESRCAGQPLKLVTPRAHHQRGSQASFEHPHGYEVMQALIARGVIGDYREPHILRFGFTPLYTRFVDAWDAVETLRDIVETDAWRAPEFATRAEVT
ncbi:kynureninase [Burkholderia oklahomensis]|uniref:Kynureninase n=1 Tax=Burkholderia oklahomensis TaxID=342113 RepID=A0AAI8FLX3_9BURK|nr:kynureninase [Burkholderia oklahomensis]AIO65464.1 kynureninase [Burkholderia oklahomensis]AJX32610.1 kynureninase [Burkholderia oklahomensis C6786]AOI43354.1 kynureninase [Burkholderia oklahomensis EO147]AOI46922.1 kynureninase [Burkholderia oklahomensis C6786]KUY58423.1 kynureninase [Burkholderia oklahomensis C6786]